MTAPGIDASEPKRGIILPRDRGALSLDLVIGVMAFLAALALGGVIIAHRNAETWQAGLTGRLSVQILAQGDSAPESEVTAALEVLRATQGVLTATPLSDADNLALVEPWLGRDVAIATLPFPRLIDVQLAPGSAPDLGALERRLKGAAPHAVLDDHGRWIARLKAVANSVVLGSIAVLALIAVGTVAAVAFATRAGLATHREIVQLLHLMGAQDRFIARAFEWHYFLAALIASSSGAILACVAFLAARSLDEAGLSGVSFLPPLGLNISELPWLFLVPTAVAAIAWGTVRASVMSALHELY